jgi:LDH2 family malate/lactate/ureidoglycolate dehydrogenase
MRTMDMEEKNALLMPVEDLKDFCKQSFLKCGLSREDADLMTDTLISSELRGVASHGIIRLPFYCQRLLDKGTNPDPKVRVIAEKPAMILVDGDNGFGQIISIRTMRMVIERAKAHGLCFAGIRNSCHFGMAAYYPMMALREEMIGIAGSNTPPVMAPWGGGKSAIGNNPLAVSVPTGKDYPVVLDMAMSVVSGGKVRLEAVKGGKIPKDWILDSKGRPTDNPGDFFPDGTLLPLGHKGFGLAIIIEILSGILTQANILSEIDLWFEKTSTPVNVGHFLMALNIGVFIDPMFFKKRVDRMIDELKASPPMEGSAGILMPGEMEHVSEQTCLKQGIPIDREVLKKLDAFADRIGIPRLTR